MSAPPVPPAREPVTIVALGDSTTAGTPGYRSPLEAPPAGDGNATSQYAYWLSLAHPDWHVVNCGVNGERSDQIRARFERDVVEAVARLVVIIAGVNDIYNGRQPEDVQVNLQWMYDRARQAGIRVVAGSIIPYNTAGPEENARMHAINAWIRNTAAHDPNMAFCDTRAAVADPQNPDRLASTSDQLHPSPEGYRLMASALVPAIEALLARPRR